MYTWGFFSYETKKRVCLQVMINEDGFIAYKIVSDTGQLIEDVVRNSEYLAFNLTTPTPTVVDEG